MEYSTPDMQIQDGLFIYFQSFDLGIETTDPTLHPLQIGIDGQQDRAAGDSDSSENTRGDGDSLKQLGSLPQSEPSAP